MEARGSFKPGHPIHITFEALANFATEDGEVRLTLPEVASAEASGWDIVITPISEDIPSHLRVRRSFAAGESVRERLSLTIPEPGYYHVIATGYAHPGVTTPAPLFAGDVSRRDFWIFVDENGGRFTDDFDTTLIAQGYRQQVGPRSSEKKQARLRGEDVTIACALMPGGGYTISSRGSTVMSPCPGMTPSEPPPPPPPATASFRFTYVDAGAANAIRPVSGARYIWKIITLAGAEIASGNGQLGQDGMSPILDCGAPAGERRLQVWMYTLNERAYVQFGTGVEASNAGHYTGGCGGHLEVRADPEMSHLFLNLVKNAAGHQARFGSYPGQIYAGLYTDTKTYYDHNHPDGELHIYKIPRMVYGEYGVMVAAHEYGHHWQDRRLYQAPAQNGLMRYTVNCAEKHPPASASSFGCAVGEAFADWYAVVVREADMPGWKADLESNFFYRTCQPGTNPEQGTTVCTDDGSIVQGAVAALFWDIIDGAWESHDVLQRTPRDLTDAITRCTVKVGSSFVPYTGVDHLIYCLDNRSPYTVALTTGTVRLFNTRATLPTAASGFSFFNGSDDFRKTWLVNLYSKRSTVGTSPTPSYSVEPDPPPSPCGTIRTCIEPT